jgi:hypothetical protein
MKKLLFIVILFVACKKENKERVTITVLERDTNVPVSGANVNLVRYNLDDMPVTVFSGVTDDNGTVRMDAQEYNTAQKVLIIKYNYWRFEGNKSTRLYVMPEGWLKLPLHPVRAYPPGTSLQFRVNAPGSSQNGSTISVTADTDSTVVLFGFGGRLNTISWQVSGDTPDLDTSGTINSLAVPRFDTLGVNTLAY